MNRDQRKILEKLYRKQGRTKSDAEKLAKQIYGIDNIRLEGLGETTPPQKFDEGEKFKLDIEKIKARKNYERTLEGYKEFVEANQETIFTAHIERPNAISAVEEPRWLFWSGDIIKVEQSSQETSRQTDGADEA